MPEARLRQLLGELHAELEREDRLDDNDKELLRKAHHEIEEAIGKQQPEPAVSARGRIEQAIERFEERHPDGVVLLQKILDALSNVGI